MFILIEDANGDECIIDSKQIYMVSKHAGDTYRIHMEGGASVMTRDTIRQIFAKLEEK